MSDTFNFSRFASYFRFDISRLWKNHTKTAILLGAGSLLAYLIVGIGGLLFDFQWAVADIPVRFFAFAMALAVLELYMARIYGFLTDRKEGSDFLLIPVSTLEKWASMLINVLILVPLLFFIVYFCVDGLICLIDPRTGTSLFALVRDGFAASQDGISQLNGELVNQGLPFRYSLTDMLIPAILSATFNYLFYLLCGLVFKRHKILNAILVIIIVASVASLISSNLLPAVLPDFEAMNQAEMVGFANHLLLGYEIVTAALVAGFATAIYFRLRKISH